MHRLIAIAVMLMLAIPAIGATNTGKTQAQMPPSNNNLINPSLSTQPTNPSLQPQLGVPSPIQLPSQPGISGAGPGMIQPGSYGSYIQPGSVPSYGTMQPGIYGTGTMQPGLPQPGMLQPGASGSATPGSVYSQPGMSGSGPMMQSGMTQSSVLPTSLVAVDNDSVYVLSNNQLWRYNKNNGQVMAYAPLPPVQQAQASFGQGPAMMQPTYQQGYPQSIQPGFQQNTQPGIQLIPRSGIQPVPGSGAGPAAQPGIQQPAQKPSGAVQPGVKPAAQPGTQPVTQPGMQPPAQPGAVISGQPSAAGAGPTVTLQPSMGSYGPMAQPSGPMATSGQPNIMLGSLPLSSAYGQPAQYVPSLAVDENFVYVIQGSKLLRYNKNTLQLASICSVSGGPGCAAVCTSFGGGATTGAYTSGGTGSFTAYCNTCNPYNPCCRTCGAPIVSPTLPIGSGPGFQPGEAVAPAVCLACGQTSVCAAATTANCCPVSCARRPLNVTLGPDTKCVLESLKGMDSCELIAAYVAALVRANAGAIAWSQLALSKACQPQLRDYARQTIASLTEENTQLASIAQESSGIMPQLALNPGDQQILCCLQNYTGADFDIAYMQAMITHAAEVRQIASTMEGRIGNATVERNIDAVASAETRRIEVFRTWLTTWYNVKV